MTRDNQFLKKGYLKTLYPIMLSVLGGTVNTLIDSAFVSQKLGNSGLAAINMSMPVYLIICTFGSLISAGASTMSAFDAGRDNMQGAEKHYRAAFRYLLSIGLIITVLGLAFCRPIVTLIAQGSDLYEYVYIYCFVTIVGAVPSLLIYIPTYYLQLEGKTRDISVMMGLIIGVDVIFDWLLLFAVDGGLGGAALASMISTFAALTYGMKKLETDTSNYHFKFERFSLSQFRRMVKFGSPTALNNLIDAVKLITLNSVILYFGGTGAVAVWAVLNSLSEFSLAFVSGVPQAAAPMEGAYYSSRENGSLRILVRLQVKAGLIIGAAYMALTLLLRPLLESVFVMEENMTLPILCLGIFCVFDVLASIWITFFQSTGKIAQSNLLVICRKFVFPVAVALLLCAVGWYLFMFLPLSGAFTLLVGVVMTGLIAKRSAGGRHSLSRILLLDDYLERENKVIDFSVFPSVDNICDASVQISGFCKLNHMEPKQTLKLRLAIEEILTVLAKKNENLESVDLRAFAVDGNTGIRIRYAGIRYNPFDKNTDDDDDFLMGVAMINKMAEIVTYTYSLGMNTINILFDTSAQQENPK